MKISILDILYFAIELTKAGVAVGIHKKLAKTLACYTTSTSIRLLLNDNKSKEIKKLIKNMDRMLGVNWRKNHVRKKINKESECPKI